MKKSIKNLEVKTVKNLESMKGGGDKGGQNPPFKPETTVLGDLSPTMP